MRSFSDSREGRGQVDSLIRAATLALSADDLAALESAAAPAA